jgi:RNA polymerase primary sigma factor
MTLPGQQKKSLRRGISELDPLRLYLKEISKIPLLTAEEELELARRARAGDKEAAQRLVEANLRFVIKVARKFQKSGVPLLDLINEGNTGLIEATRRFDPERNVRFLTYAVWWIRQAIQHYLSHGAKTIRVSPKISATLYKLTKLSESMQAEPAALSRDSLAQKLGITVEQLDQALQFARNMLSMEAPLNETGELVLGDMLPQKLFSSAEDLVATDEDVRLLQRLISDLSKKEAAILKMRFGLEGGEPMTLREIGDKLKLSRERIRQLEAQSLNKLRQNVSRIKSEDCLNTNNNLEVYYHHGTI